MPPEAVSQLSLHQAADTQYAADEKEGIEEDEAGIETSAVQEKQEDHYRYADEGAGEYGVYLVKPRGSASLIV